MKNKIAKERTIFDNYHSWETYSDETLTEMALDNEWVDNKDDITENMLWQWRNEQMNFFWDCVWSEMLSYFKGKTVGFFGEVGLWHGIYKTGKIGDFEELWYKATKDCDYIKIYDENGHLYLTCSHHDGTCHFEIKEITSEGNAYLDRWEWGTDNRTEEQCHNQIYKRYSKLPRFAEKVYGCKAREYEPITKGRLIDKLNNEASSRYSA